jgi:hypothetical protein
MASKHAQDSASYKASLIAQGVDKKDIVRDFVAVGAVVYHPVIGEDGKPHMVRKVFKKEKPAAATPTAAATATVSA